MLPDPPFWLVWAEDGDAPHYRHASEHSAEQEARRLAAEHPGKRFCVLQPIARIVTAETVLERFERDPVPF